jgi:hypothetical protein
MVYIYIFTEFSICMIHTNGNLFDSLHKLSGINYPKLSAQIIKSELIL